MKKQLKSYAGKGPLTGSVIKQVGIILGGFITFAGGSVFAHDHDHQPPQGPEPALSVGDFDGSGEVTKKDILLLKAQVASDEYIAFFDRNADGILDQEDIAITKSERGLQSQPADQELAMLFHNTKHYRDRQRAIEAGFIPATPAFAGHGEHWIKHPNAGLLSYTFIPAHPAGLNYDEEGRLWGVFYYIGPSPSRPDGSKFPPQHEFQPFMAPPPGFTGDRDHWHSHVGTCFRGLDYENPTLNAEELMFSEGLSPRECLPEDKDSGVWNPKFYMIHAWIYALNPNGTFAGAHPHLAQHAPPEESARPHGRVDPLDPHPDYPFKGGTLCAWLAEAERAPDFCTSVETTEQQFPLEPTHEATE